MEISERIVQKAFEAQGKSRKKKCIKPPLLSQLGINSEKMSFTELYFYVLWCLEYHTRGQKYNERIKKKLVDIVSCYLWNHSKVCWARIELTFPVGYILNDERYISRFIDDLRKYLKRKMKLVYIWVTEQNTSVNPHYHLFLLLNGDKIRRVSPECELKKKIDELWNKGHGMDSISTSDIEQEGFLLRSDNYNNGERIDRLMYDASYMAKERYKYAHKIGRRNFGMSQIPKACKSIIPTKRKIKKHAATSQLFAAFGWKRKPDI